MEAHMHQLRQQNQLLNSTPSPSRTKLKPIKTPTRTPGELKPITPNKPLEDPNTPSILLRKSIIEKTNVRKSGQLDLTSSQKTPREGTPDTTLEQLGLSPIEPKSLIASSNLEKVDDEYENIKNEKTPKNEDQTGDEEKKRRRKESKRSKKEKKERKKKKQSKRSEEEKKERKRKKTKKLNEVEMKDVTEMKNESPVAITKVEELMPKKETQSEDKSQSLILENIQTPNKEIESPIVTSADSEMKYEMKDGKKDDETKVKKKKKRRSKKVKKGSEDEQSVTSKQSVQEAAEKAKVDQKEKLRPEPLQLEKSSSENESETEIQSPAQEIIADPKPDKPVTPTTTLSKPSNLPSQGSLLSTFRKCINLLQTGEFIDYNTQLEGTAPKKALFSDTEKLNELRRRPSALQLEIIKCDPLKKDTHVIHPVVRISVFDLSTGKLLKKDNASDEVVYDFEYVNNDGLCEYILPVLSKPSDLRALKLLAPKWDDKIIYNQNFLSFMNENVVFVFEILEFGNDLPFGRTITSPDGFYKIAWAFLKPVSSNGRANCEKVCRLQLYEYPQEYKVLQYVTSCINQNNISQDEDYANVTAASLVAMKHKKKYPSSLYVQLSSTKPKIKERKQDETILFNLNQTTDIKSNEEDKTQIEEEDEEDLKRQRMKREEKEPCEIPDQLLYQLESGTRGCLCVQFSHSGQYLACGCTDESYSYIKVYDMRKGKLVTNFERHMNIIYEMKWSLDDSMIASASSDGTVKIWNTKFTKKTPKISSHEISLHHPSYVYTCAFHPNMENRILVTGCYDHKIRIWNIETKEIIKEIDAHESRINNVLFNEKGTRMFTTDASGIIKEWSSSCTSIEDVQASFTILKTINERELMRHTLTFSRLYPIETPYEQLLLHSQDNMIRLLDTSTKTIRRFTGVKCALNSLKSNVSPDGKYIVTGSTDGKVYFWDCKTKELVKKEGHDFGFGKDIIYDISWSRSEHLIALCSFTEYQPIRVYCFIKSDEDRIVQKNTQKEKKITQKESSDIGTIITNVLLESLKRKMDKSVPPLPPTPVSLETVQKEQNF